MANFLNTSPFIKAAFLTAALIAGSISHASHAADLMTDIAMQGLEHELNLDTDGDFTKDLEQLSQGICVGGDEILDKLKKAKADTEIARDKAKEEAKKKYSEIMRNIIDLQNKFEKLTGFRGITPDPQEIRKLTNEIARLKTELKALDVKVNALEAKIKQFANYITFVENCQKSQH